MQVRMRGECQNRSLDLFLHTSKRTGGITTGKRCGLGECEESGPLFMAVFVLSGKD